MSLTYLITIAATIAMVAKAFGAYAAALGFANASPLWIDAFASGITILLVLLNIADAAMVGETEVVLVGIKLVILAVLMLAGTYGMVGHAAVKHVTPHFLSLISSVGLTFFAYAGFGVMTNAAGRVSNPKRGLPPRDLPRDSRCHLAVCRAVGDRARKRFHCRSHTGATPRSRWRPSRYLDESVMSPYPWRRCWPPLRASMHGSSRPWRFPVQW